MEQKGIQLQTVLDFWFEELSAEDWFSGSKSVDQLIIDRFFDLHTAVAAGEYWKYRTTGQSFLAEVIVLDQFSRNLFRGLPQAFAYDGQALTLAQQAIAAGFDKDLSEDRRAFLYMPFMHSESQKIHQTALPLFESIDAPEALKQEHIHKAIIDEFGRYPHRNEILGRTTTAAEHEYLENNQEDFFVAPAGSAR